MKSPWLVVCDLNQYMTITLYLLIPYSTKRWWGKTLVNLAKRMSFANIFPSQIPDPLIS